MIHGAERDEAIRTLGRAAWRYHHASLQDSNPMIAARHNGYAVAVIDALRDVASEEEVKKVMGWSLAKMRKDIYAVQDRLERKALEIMDDLRKKGYSLTF